LNKLARLQKINESNPVTQVAIQSLTQHCRQEAETALLAKALALELSRLLQQHSEAHLNISLEGDLGAGKTTFARHLIQGFGYAGKVKSPTYTLCEPYLIEIKSGNEISKAIQATVYHFDLYRMRDPLEWQEAGFAEHFDAPGFCLIEWPEKAEDTLPAFDIRIELAAGKTESERNVTLSAFSEQGKTVLPKL